MPNGEELQETEKVVDNKTAKMYIAQNAVSLVLQKNRAVIKGTTVHKKNSLHFFKFDVSESFTTVAFNVFIKIANAKNV